jgi:dolichol-phosphate mannosyltransferase
MTQQSRANRRIKLSPIIACYKEAQTIPIMYERLVAVCTKIGVDYEIIFVNNGSPDDSATILADLAARDKHVVVVTLTRNFQSQSAFTSGMRVATGDAVVLLDGDLQDPPELIEEFVAKWNEGNDVVYGQRVKRVAPLLMRASYWLFYRIFRKLSYIDVPLDAGDFSLLDRKVVDALNRLPEKNRFLRGLRAWVGFRQTGVPYLRPDRMFGVTTNSWLRNVGWARKAIVSFSYAPLDVISFLAFATVTASVVLIVAQVIIRLVRPELTPTGFTTLIVLILFVGGIQLFCLSIIGSYLAHIYDEVKGRPPYIVASVLNDPSHPTEDESADAVNLGQPARTT